jgi:hypothetical protein
MCEKCYEDAGVDPEQLKKDGVLVRVIDRDTGQPVATLYQNATIKVESDDTQVLVRVLALLTSEALTADRAFRSHLERRQQLDLLMGAVAGRIPYDVLAEAADGADEEQEVLDATALVSLFGPPAKGDA